eukprot:TRINITY_DN51551_c0_g1_i1.p1 TRINITY_DN51551_c0_g1~~TRINITY_DN51551_c0_g1_i1.p1  ORF type:complete len:560 (-),score=81.42 TRINITY_DN51551_c0_g1_i1:150-1829(-)
MGSLVCRYLFLASALLSLFKALSAAGMPQPRGSPWLQPNAVQDVVDELVHHFHGNASSKNSAFVDRLMKRIYVYQEDLRPLYMTLPKNGQGHLDLQDVGQALHRVFVRRYQMHLRGLTMFGDTSGGAAPAASVEEFLEKAIESGLASNGFTNRELSVFAVALEHLLHEETRGILKKIYEMLDVPLDSAATKNTVEKVLEAYVVFLFVRQDPNREYDITKDALSAGIALHRNEQSPLWDLCSQKLRSRLAAMPNDVVPFSALLNMAESFEQGLGAMHQEAVCDARKQVLASDDVVCDSMGRLPLESLRAKGFGKSLEALKLEGVVANSSGPPEHVYFANWLGSSENCHIKTDFYTVCCADPCEALLQKIEITLNAPHMSANQIESIAPLLQSGSQSKTVAELGNYFKAQTAEAGTVNIHAYEFAQFLHHAVPCDCPLPPQTSEQRPPTSTTSSQQLPTNPTSVAPSSMEPTKPQIEGTQAVSQRRQQRAQLIADGSFSSTENSNESRLFYFGSLSLLLFAAVAVGVSLHLKTKHASLKPTKMPFQDGKWTSEMLEMKGVV